MGVIDKSEVKSEDTNTWLKNDREARMSD